MEYTKVGDGPTFLILATLQIHSIIAMIYEFDLYNMNTNQNDGNNEMCHKMWNIEMKLVSIIWKVILISEGVL